MKYLLILLVCFTVSCADDTKKKAFYDLPDQGMDVEDFETPDQSTNLPDQSTSLPDLEELPDQSPEPDLPIESGPIKITSWNVLCLREDPTEEAFCNTDLGQSFLRSPEQLEAIRQHILAQDTDLLFLQEVENEAATENLLPDWDIHVIGEGSLKLALAVPPGSTAEVLNVSALTELDLGTSALRQGLVAEVEHAGVSVQIMSVHLKSGCQVAPFNSNTISCEELRQQLEILKTWVREREAQNQPYMLVGDFNRTMENFDPFIVELEGAAGKPLLRLTTGQRPSCWDHLPEAPSYPSFIDHQIVSPSLVDAWGTPTFDIYHFNETYPYAWLYISDHCPISSSFQ